MNSEQLLISMLERILEKQDVLIETSIEHTHMLTDVNKRVSTLEQGKTDKKKACVETQKTWIPVVLKIIEVLALFIGALLGINAVL